MSKTLRPLGASLPGGNRCCALSPSKLPDSERIRILEEQIAYMGHVIEEIQKAMREANCAYAPAAASDENLNKDGIPIGTVCTGATEKSQFLLYLTVLKDGYQVGSKIYDSLSAAAEDVSGVRRSGWTFWKLPGGIALKDAYKR